MDSGGGEVVKWYTRARKFPHLIGRTPDGTKIWGGPYTLTQAVGAGAMLFAGVNTTNLWAHYGLLGNAGILLGTTYALVLVLGRIPVGSRNPISALTGGVHALAAPRTGRLGGRPVRLRRPRRLHHHLTLQTPAPPERTARASAPSAAHASSRADVSDAAPASARTHPPTAAPAPLPAPALVPAPSPSPENPAAPGAPVLTGVQSLLARAAANTTGERAGASRAGGR